MVSIVILILLDCYYALSFFLPCVHEVLIPGGPVIADGPYGDNDSATITITITITTTVTKITITITTTVTIITTTTTATIRTATQPLPQRKQRF